MDIRNSDNSDASTSALAGQSHASDAPTTRNISQNEVDQLLEDNNLLSEHVDRLEAHSRRLKARLIEISSELLDLQKKYSKDCQSPATSDAQLTDYVEKLAVLYDIPVTICSSSKSLEDLLQRIVFVAQRERFKTTDEEGIGLSKAISNDYNSDTHLPSPRLTQSPTEPLTDLPTTKSLSPQDLCVHTSASPGSASPAIIRSDERRKKSIADECLEPDSTENLSSISTNLGAETFSSSFEPPTTTSSIPKISSRLTDEQKKDLRLKKKAETKRWMREELTPLIICGIEQGIYRLGESPPSDNSVVVVKDSEGNDRNITHTKTAAKHIRHVMKYVYPYRGNIQETPPAVEAGTDQDNVKARGADIQLDKALATHQERSRTTNEKSSGSSEASGSIPLGHNTYVCSPRPNPNTKGLFTMPSRTRYEFTPIASHKRSLHPDPQTDPPSKLRKLDPEISSAGAEVPKTSLSNSKSSSGSDGTLAEQPKKSESQKTSKRHERQRRQREELTPFIMHAIEQGFFGLDKELPCDGSIVVLKDKDGNERVIIQSKAFASHVRHVRDFKRVPGNLGKGRASSETGETATIPRNGKMRSWPLEDGEIGG